MTARDVHDTETRSRAAEHRAVPEPRGLSDRTLLIGHDEIGIDDQLYWPSVLPVHEVLAPADRLGRYYLYYSASHHGDAAIRLAYADDPLGPYTDHGRVFRDPEGGHHTETPEVVWNDEGGRFHLYYHDFIGTGGSQATGLALSADGRDWDRHGLVIDGYDTTPGNHHTGYARIHRAGRTWVAHHLMGGGGSSGFGVSYSTDGVDWTTDPRRLTNGSDVTGRPDRRISWSHTRILDRGGTRWWIGSESPISWGGTATHETETNSRIVRAPFVDERSIVGPPTVLADPVEPWEGEATNTPDTLVVGDTAYLFYATEAGETGNIGGAEIVWGDG